MSLLSDFEAKLSADAKVVWNELSAFEQVIAAKLSVGISAAEQTVINSLPGAAAMLKSYVLNLVTLAEKDYLNAPGDVKYSVVFYQLWAAIKAGLIPGVTALSLSVMKASIEAAVLAMGA